MKLTGETIDVLKNFSAINNNILIQPGSKIETSDDPKGMTIFARANVPDVFPTKIGIYDLNGFLSIVNLLGGAESTDFEFNERNVILRSEDNGSRVKYWYASEDVLSFPEKEIGMPPPQVSFEMSGAMLTKLKRAAATFGHSTLCMYNNGGYITGKVYDPQVPSSNTFEMDICKYENDGDVNFEFIFDIQQIKYISFGADDTFDVNFAAKGRGRLSEFSVRNVSYYVAVDSKSKMDIVEDK